MILVEKRRNFAKENQLANKRNKQQMIRKTKRMRRKKKTTMTIWENMICGVMMIKTTKKILHPNGIKIISIQELRINQGPEVDQDLEIDADQDILGHGQVLGHLHPAEDE